VIYRLATTVSGDADPINSWELADDAMSGKIGTGITNTSGIFSFANTGVYRIDFTGSAYDSGSDDVQIACNIWSSSDSGSNYDKHAQGMTNLHHGAQHTYSISAIVDITNTTTDRVKFTVGGNQGELNASTNQTFSFVSFTRLGNT